MKIKFRYNGDWDLDKVGIKLEWNNTSFYLEELLILKPGMQDIQYYNVLDICTVLTCKIDKLHWVFEELFRARKEWSFTLFAAKIILIYCCLLWYFYLFQYILYFSYSITLFFFNFDYFGHEPHS
jgi:hypothetical protein